MEIYHQIVRVTTTGDPGIATGEAFSAVMHGFLLDIYLDFHASAPATTDTTISHEDTKYGNVLAVSNTATDVLHAPRLSPVNTSGAAITNAHDRIPLNGRVKVALAQCNALTDAVVAYIRYLRVA